MIKNKIKDIILLTLEKAVEGTVVLADLYENPRRFAKIGPRYQYPKSALSMTILRLRRGGLVEKIVKEDQIILKLTQAGKDWLLKNKAEDSIKWDGFWRIVIFDIPEKHKTVREILRKRLKGWGFNKWQKSVWVSKKPLTFQLRKLTEDLEISDWVLVIESNNVGNST